MSEGVYLSSLELCAGAGGQALGVEQGGFSHVASVELDPAAIATIRANRRTWNPVEADVRAIDGRDYRGVDLIAAGAPCPPFSIAGKQLGADDDRDLFPAVLRIVAEAKPRAVMLENVRGLAGARFDDYRKRLLASLERAGYRADWRILNASDFGVPQLRPRFVLIALRHEHFSRFKWPQPAGRPQTVGETLRVLMGSRGWPGADEWARNANGIAPTLVGGSKKHGGPDLGPTRAKREWRALGVDGMGVADLPPGPEFDSGGHPKLTVPMAALIQGFPPDWKFEGKKTPAYRQVGNAFPPPVAKAVASALREAIAPRVRRQPVALASAPSAFV